jgi:K+-transporting ATPase ATPase C chain
MLSLVRPALVSVGLFTLLLGLAYPLLITGLGAAAFPHQAGGSLIRQGGRVVGSELVGQAFARPEYLHPRPSAAGEGGYDASASSGSNLGPLSEDLAERVRDGAEALRAEAPGAAIPADAVTASASGLDPHISPAYAALQAPRISRARGISTAEVQAVIDAHTQGRTFGVLGQPRVNVLKANLALDALYPPERPSPE